MPFTPLNVALTLGLSLFFGLAFEEFYAQEIPKRPGGIRTFPLLALAGAALYALDQARGLAFAAGLVIIGTWIHAYYRRVTRERPASEQVEGDFVVPLCILLAYVIGALALSQPPWVAVAVTVAATLLLAGRKELHRIASAVPTEEIFTAGQFLLLVGVFVPLLPDTPLAGFSAITPHKVLLAVVAVSSLSYASYLVQRYLRPKGTLILAGILGGLYSSTATTVVLARRSRQAGAVPYVNTGIVLATALMYVRVLAIVAIFNQPLGLALAPRFAVLFVLSLMLAGLTYLFDVRVGQLDPALERPGNPLQLGTALTFAALFILVTFASGWTNVHYGQRGIDLLAAIVGFSDIDPLVLSIAQGRLVGVTLPALATATLIAAASNNVLKAIYALSFGTFRRMAAPAGALLVLSGASVLAGLLKL